MGNFDDWGTGGESISVSSEGSDKSDDIEIVGQDNQVKPDVSDSDNAMQTQQETESDSEEAPQNADDTSEETPEKEAKPKPKEKSKGDEKADRTQAKTRKRINTLTKRAKTSESRVDELEQELEQTKRELTLARGSKTEPDVGDYDDLDKYEADHAAWEAKQAEGLEELPQKDIAAAEAIRDLKYSADVALDDLPEDYQEVIDKGEFNLSRATLIAVSEMEEGPAILYEIATNPDLANKLHRIKTESRLVQELDKLADSLGDTEIKASKETTRSKRTTSAPEPITPVGGSDAPKAFDPDKASASEYINEMNKKQGDSRFW